MSYPLAPSVGDKHVVGNTQYEYTSISTWDIVGSVGGTVVEDMLVDIAATEVVANAAAPQVTTYTKTESDTNFESADSTIVKQSDVVDTLTSTSVIAPLSAAQGKALQDVKISSDTTLQAGTSQLTNAVYCTQAVYDGLTPTVGVFYVIVPA